MTSSEAPSPHKHRQRQHEMIMEKASPVNERYMVLISKRFVILSVLSCIIVAFAVGRSARMLLLVNPQNRLLVLGTDIRNENNQYGKYEDGSAKSLPEPKMKDGKVPPQTEYTSKTFDTTKSASTQSRWIVTDAGTKKCEDIPEKNCVASPYIEDEDEREDNGHHELYLPAGQHLLLDIENVDGNFLNSEERLAHAMLKLIDECGLTLLSYHCHKMVPMGVSCAGVLLESHVSFHTWPNEGVITFDLFTCGPNSLLPIVPLAIELFAVRKEIDNEAGRQAKEPNSVWAYKTRGFIEGGINEDALIAAKVDMEYFPVGKMTAYKNEIISAKTEFQEVKVFDVLIPNVQNLEAYSKSLQNDGSYESLHPELFAPDRIVFLDGVLQSRRSGEAAYHETLIHPSLFAHPNPKRVAIIGGGEGASLREVLKHSTVEHVMMIEIDEMMVSISREYLPSWSDCSMLVGSAPSCFNDPRVEVQYRDAFQWFTDNFPVDGSPLIAPFDVIIMDALDPQVRKEFVNALYDEGPFLKSIPNALEEKGIFISQVGEAASYTDPAEEYTDNQNRLRLFNSLVKVGFKNVRTYIDNMQSGFSRTWQFVVAFKGYDSEAEWLANPSLVDLKIRTRSIPTIDGGSPFEFFDGPTMQTFYFPPKPIEVVYCRGHQNARYCKEEHRFDPERENLPLSSTLEVRQSSIGKEDRRGVFAKIDIPVKSYIGLENMIQAISGDAHSYDLIMKTHDTTEYSWGSTLYTYIHEYGEIHSHNGRNSFIVGSAVFCFINHACDGKNNFGYNLTVTQTTADPKEFSRQIIEKYEGLENISNPAADRQSRSYTKAVSLRAINQGEELLDNYLAKCDESAE